MTTPSGNTEPVHSPSGIDARVVEPLPCAIRSCQVKIYTAAALFFVFSLSTCEYLHSSAPSLLAAFSVYLLWKGFNVGRRFRSGAIREITVCCTGVKSSRYRKSMTVLFRTEEVPRSEVPQEFFRFSNQPKSAENDFIVDHPYVIYFDIENPQTLLAYISI